MTNLTNLSSGEISILKAIEDLIKTLVIYPEKVRFNVIEGESIIIVEVKLDSRDVKNDIRKLLACLAHVVTFRIGKRFEINLL